MGAAGSIEFIMGGCKETVIWIVRLQRRRVSGAGSGGPWSALFYPVHNLGILPFSDQNTNAPTIKLNNVALK